MAENTPYSVGFDIKAKINYQEIKDANVAVGDLQKKFEQLDKHKGPTNAAGSITQDMNSASRATGKLNDSIKGVTANGKGLKTTAENVASVGDHSRTAAGQVNALKTSIDKIKSAGTQTFRAVSDHVHALGEQSEATRKKLDRLNETGKKFKSVGYSMLPASAAIGAAFIKGAKDATKLQNRYTVIKNLIKTGGESTRASVQNTAKMMSQGRQMSLKYGESQNSIAAGYETLVRRGYDSNQALAAQKTYLMGAKASGDSYTDVVNNAASALEQFGLKSKNVTTMTKNTKLAVNQMAYAADLTATSFKDLGEAMKYAGPDAKAAHQTLSMTASGIGTLSNAGIEGSQAGTSMRQIYQRLTNPPAKGKAPNAMKSIGLDYSDFDDAKGNLMSLADIFDKLNSHMKGMSSTKQGAIYAALFGSSASSAADILGTHVKELRDLNGQVAKAQDKDNGKGYIAGLSQKNLKSWQSQFKAFKSSVSDLGMSFAKDVLPSVTPMVKQLNTLVKDFGKLPEPTKKLVSYGVVFAGIAGPLAVGLGGIASALAVIGKSKVLNAASNLMMPSLKGGTKTASVAGEAKVLGGYGTKAAKGLDFKLGSGALAGSKLGSYAADAEKGGTLLKGVKAIGSKVPVLDTALAATSLIGINKKNAGSKIGNFGGSLAGMEAGAALGSFLGPLGTVAGGAIGGWAGGKLGSKAGSFVQKANKQSHTGTMKDYQYTPGIGYQYVPNGGQSAGKSKSKAKPKSPYSELSDSNATYIKKATKLEEQGNIAWAEAAGKTSSKLKTTYGQLYKLADKQSNKELSAHKSRLSYLEKEGLITKSTASGEYSAEKTSAEKRLASLKSSLSKITNNDNLSGKKRYALMYKVNSQILALTDKGSKKQQSIMAKLVGRTSSLSTAGYAKVVTSSNKSYKATVNSAQKTYNRSVSYANRRYKKEKSAAAAEFGVNSKRYKRIVRLAEKQRDKSIDNATSQYTNTVKYAKKQRVAVIKEAQKEAAGAEMAFSDAAADVASSIPALVKQNSKVFGYNPSKNKTDSQSMKDHYNASGKLADSYAKMTGTAKKPSGDKTSSVFPANASGGLIAGKQTALVGEGGTELLYTVNGRKARLLGANGPEFTQVNPGERILNARDTNKVMRGGLGHVLPGYAAGNASLGTASAGKSEDKFSKKSKTTWSKTEKDTSKSTQKIKKNTVGDYDGLQKSSAKQLSQLSSGSNSQWKSIVATTGKRTDTLRKSTVNDFDTMQKSSQKQMDQLETGVVASAKDTAVGFGKEMNRMKGYANTAMNGAIKQLNQGISGIDSVLGQFGGNGNVIKPIKYAAGSNGALDRDQIAMVNDASAGPRQEIVLRGGQAYAPQGNNRVLPLHKGDQVLNGTQSQQWAKANGIEHYAKGSGVSNSTLSKLIDSSNSHPDKQFNTEFTSKMDAAGSALQKGTTALSKAASVKTGQPWNKEGWSQLEDAKSGGGSSAGGNWLHNPGMPESNGFNAARKGGIHDGVDFSGAAGTAIKAVHGGTVVLTGASNPWNDYKDLGDIITVKSDDGYQEIYQEFGKNIKVHPGQQIRTGQTIATLGNLPGHDLHVHVGVSKGSLWNHGGSSHNGWYDVTKMHGNSSGLSKKKTASSALTKLVSKQLASQIKWVGKNLAEDDIGSLGGVSLSGSLASRARTLAAALKQLYPASTNAGIAAVLGNWNFESGGLNAGAINPGGGASGLGQWLSGRKTNLINYAKRHGENWKSAKAQLEFAVKGEASDSALLRSVLSGSGSVASLAAKFSNGWERGGHTAQHVNGARQIAAVLHGNGGWSTAGAANIFGEVPGQPEVAINPARHNADNLINQTIQARADADKSSPSADFLKSVKAPKVSKSKTKIKPQITININGDISDDRMLKKAQDMIDRSMTKAFKQINDEYGLDDSVW